VPEREGKAVAATIQAALDSARVTRDDVDHVNCHGTATLQNDKAEAKGELPASLDAVVYFPVAPLVLDTLIGSQPHMARRTWSVLTR
jgi:hypothetical protein